MKPHDKRFNTNDWKKVASRAVQRGLINPAFSFEECRRIAARGIEAGLIKPPTLASIEDAEKAINAEFAKKTAVLRAKQKECMARLRAERKGAAS